MNRKHYKTAATLAAAVAVAGVATVLALRDSSPAPQTAKEAAAPAAPRPAKTEKPASAAAPAMTLDEWAARVAETGIEDFRSLMEQAMKIEDADLRNAVVVTILDRWMKEDAAAFISYMSALEVHGKDADLATLARALQESLTKLDADQAASDEVLVIVQRLINYLASHDPEQALAWAKRFLLDDTLDHALVAVARGFAKTDIARALEIIESMKSSVRRGQALALVGGIWANTDPDAAMKWAMKLGNPGERALALNQVLMVMAAQGLETAAAQELLQQANLLDEQYKKSRAEDLAARGISEADLANDPEAHNEMVESGVLTAPGSPDVEMLELASKAIAAKMAANDPAAAAQFAESIENDYLKHKTTAGVLEGWAKTDPTAAIAYANANYPGDSALMTALFGSWASVNGEAAAAGVSMIADPSLRALALEAAVTTWSARGDTGAIADYLSTLPPAEVSDGTRVALVNAMSQTSPEQAWALAQSISDPKAQYRALKSAFSHLVIESPVQAEALLTSSNLSNDTSGRLQDMLDAVVGK